MSANGSRRSRRPRIEMVSTARSAAEAAAVVAAVERFLADTAPAPAPTEQVSRWQATALREGVSARQLAPGGWNGPKWNEI